MFVKTFAAAAALLSAADGAALPIESAASSASAVVASSVAAAAAISAAPTPVVAAEDTVRTVVNLGIQPHLLTVPIKHNPDYTPNVAAAVQAVNAKYIVVEERLRLAKREAEAEAAAELQKRGRTFATATSAVGRTFATAGSVAAANPNAPLPWYCAFFPQMSGCARSATTSSKPASSSSSTRAPTSSSAAARPVLTSSSTTTTSSSVARTTTSSSSSIRTTPTTTSSSSITPTTSSSASATTSSVPLILQADNIQLDSEFLSPVQLGSNNDALNLLLDTGSADLWMFNTDCSNCARSGHTLYNPSKSTTFKNTSSTFSLLYGDGSQTSGYLGFDTVTLAGAPIQAQSIDVAQKVSQNLVSNPMDGIMGLGFRSLTSHNVNTPIDNMLAQKLIPKGQFGVQFVKNYQWQGYGGGGQWTFGGYDSSVVSGPLTNVPLTQAQYWMVKMDQVSVGSVYSYTPTQNVIVDSGTTLIMLDSQSVANIHNQLPGARVYTDPSSGSQHYQIFCNATANAYQGRRNVYFSLSGTKYAVPVSDLAWYPESNGYCYSGIQPWSNNFGILGIMFLKNAYVVFDQDNKQIQVSKRTDVNYIAD